MDESPTGLPFQQAFSIERSLRHGYRSLLRCFPILFVGGCLKACTDGGGGGGGGGNSEAPSPEAVQQWWDDFRHGGAFAWSADPAALLGSAGLPDTAEWVVIAVILAVVVFVITLLLAFRAWLVPGYIRLHREVLETGAGRWETLFSGADRFFAMFAWQLLAMVVGLGTLALAASPAAALLAWGITQEQVVGLVLGGGLLLVFTLPIAAYVGLGLALADSAVVLDELGPTDALARSWSLASGNRLWLFLYLLVTGLFQLVVTLVGLCFCCVGVYLTRAMAYAIRDVGLTSAYLLHTRPEDETRGWSIWSWERG